MAAASEQFPDGPPRGKLAPSGGSVHTKWESVGAILEQVHPGLPGFSIEILPEIDSTNSELMRRGKAGQTDPVLLVAEHQTAGRGRLGRVWIDTGTGVPQEPQFPAGPPQGKLAPSGGSEPHAVGSVGAISTLMFSLGLTLSPMDWSGLSLAVGLSLAQSLHPDIRLKWPNDLWLTAPHGDSKLGGILVETSPLGADAVQAFAGGTGAARGPARWVVIGVGINILPRSAQGLSTPPAWLQRLEPGAGAPAALQRVVGPLVAALQRFEQLGFAPLQRAFNQRDALAGRALTLSDGTEGRGQGVDEFGALVVATASGVVKITSSEVTVRPA